MRRCARCSATMMSGLAISSGVAAVVRNSLSMATPIRSPPYRCLRQSGRSARHRSMCVCAPASAGSRRRERSPHLLRKVIHRRVRTCTACSEGRLRPHAGSGIHAFEARSVYRGSESDTPGCSQCPRRDGRMPSAHSALETWLQRNTAASYSRSVAILRARALGHHAASHQHARRHVFDDNSSEREPSGAVKCSIFAQVAISLILRSSRG
jgi:hypothetical protein